jgi:hypothetical protein
MSKLLNSADNLVTVWSEELARLLARRTLLSRGFKGLAAGAVAFSVGSVLDPKVAFATPCPCSCGRSPACDIIGYPCPYPTGCPSGCSVCTTSSGCSLCIYPSGYWVCCTGCGSGGGGHELCYDCKCGSCSTGICTCKSACICPTCQTPADFAAEIGRLNAAAGAGQGN